MYSQGLGQLHTIQIFNFVQIIEILKNMYLSWISENFVSYWRMPSEMLRYHFMYSGVEWE